MAAADCYQHSQFAAAVSGGTAPQIVTAALLLDRRVSIGWEPGKERGYIMGADERDAFAYSWLNTLVQLSYAQRSGFLCLFLQCYN